MKELPMGQENFNQKHQKVPQGNKNLSAIFEIPC